MATKPNQSKTKPAADKPAPQDDDKTRALSAAPPMDFEADSGRGMEGADAESYAIPFITVLQSNSPQVDEASGSAVEGAKAGMLFNTVTGKMYDGKAGLLMIPCAFRRVFLRWGPRSGEGAGFKGEHSPEHVAAARDSGDIVEHEGRLYTPLENGTVNEKRCDRWSDTRNHYVLVLDPESGFWSPALLSLASTQIKKSRNLMAALHDVKFRRADGTAYTPATFANMVRITTQPESNDKGNWFGVTLAIDGKVSDPAAYAAARAFHQTVSKGAVAANYEAAADAAGGSGAGARPSDEGF